VPVFLSKGDNKRPTLTFLRISMLNDRREAIRTAVIGHRLLDTNNDLTTSIQKVLAQIIQDHPGFDYHLLSALAEGSDQFIAGIALQYKEIKLIVPLPLPEKQYLLDFETDEGRQKFKHLLNIADHVLTLTKNSDHDATYDDLGRYLIDKCHVLIALWNGEYSGKRGGTGEVVKRALQMDKLIYWIYAESGNEEGEVGIKLQKNPGDITILGNSRDSRVK
jgi:uncharacterized phage-like protein YoqJ